MTAYLIGLAYYFAAAIPPVGIGLLRCWWESPPARMKPGWMGC